MQSGGPDKTVFVVAQREEGELGVGVGRGPQIYVSQEIPQICGVALPLSPAELRRSGFLINSWLVFPLCIPQRVFCVCPRENMCTAAPPYLPCRKNLHG